MSVQTAVVLQVSRQQENQSVGTRSAKPLAKPNKRGAFQAEFNGSEVMAGRPPISLKLTAGGKAARTTAA